MKKILVLMLLGFCFCQDVLTTREYEVSIHAWEMDNAVNGNQQIEINLDSLTGTNLDFYKVEINLNSLLELYNSDIFENNINEIILIANNSIIECFKSQVFNEHVIENQWLCSFGAGYIYSVVGSDEFMGGGQWLFLKPLFHTETPIISDLDVSVDLSLLITAKFPEGNSTGLNGDINGDNELNIVDVVQLVQIILDGETTGSIFELLDVIRG